MDSVKCSRRRHRVSIEPLLVVLALAFGHSAGAQPADANARGSATLDAFLSEVHRLSADFKQEIYETDDKPVETETGTLSLARPGRFRWTQAPPSELIVVADG